MATTQNGVEILIDLDVHDMNALVLEPAFNYDNIYQRRMNVYKFWTGKNKVRMTHLSRPDNVLQPKTDCNTWKPTVNFKLRPYEIGVKDFELMGEQCPDEFDEACARNLGGAREELTRTNAAINAIEMAMAMQLRKGIVASTYKIAYFGDEDFGAKVDAGFYNLSHMSPKERTKLIEMLEHQNGWFSEMEARVSDTSEYGRVRYVDSNDGTINGNATNPANIAAYLTELRTAAHPILQFWNLDRPNSEWPVYLLQRGLFNALISYYRSLGTEMANKLIIEGLTIPNATTFDGYPVLMVPEWDMFDYETGRIAANGQSKTQRAIFTAQQNLAGLTNGQSIEGRPESALVIERSPLLKDKGKKWMYANIGMGFGIAQPVLMVASWNSSDTYA